MNILRSLLDRYRCWRYPNYKRTYALRKERQQILSGPRYTEGIIHLGGRALKFIDNASYYFIYDELFEKRIYEFSSSNESPYIIDGGANIGLSVIYFKQLFPKARIVAFEPDRRVFNVLTENVHSFQLSDVTLVERALWNEETTLRFFSEGADAGHISPNSSNENITMVKAVRLRPYLENKKVDFLKIDIEGAETTVLKDCSDLLKNVERIFVEYHSFEGQEQSLPELLNLLKMSGFRLNISSPGLKSESPFVAIKTYGGMDMQLNIYGIRN